MKGAGGTGVTLVLLIIVREDDDDRAGAVVLPVCAVVFPVCPVVAPAIIAGTIVSSGDAHAIHTLLGSGAGHGKTRIFAWNAGVIDAGFVRGTVHIHLTLADWCVVFANVVLWTESGAAGVGVQAEVVAVVVKADRIAWAHIALLAKGYAFSNLGDADALASTVVVGGTLTANGASGGALSIGATKEAAWAARIVGTWRNHAFAGGHDTLQSVLAIGRRGAGDILADAILTDVSFQAVVGT